MTFFELINDCGWSMYVSVEIQNFETRWGHVRRSKKVAASIKALAASSSALL